MKPDNNEKIIAYIDGANLYNGVASLGWELDYKRFRKWLEDKFKVQKAYIFIGLIQENAQLYTMLQDAGFELHFKPTVKDNDGQIKGNCDADLVLKTTTDYFENKSDKVVIVSSDGDYYSLVEFLQKHGKLLRVLSPAMPKKCSLLLKRTDVPITCLGDFEHILKRKSPRRRQAP